MIHEQDFGAPYFETSHIDADFIFEIMGSDLLDDGQLTTYAYFAVDTTGRDERGAYRSMSAEELAAQTSLGLPATEGLMSILHRHRIALRMGETNRYRINPRLYWQGTFADWKNETSSAPIPFIHEEGPEATA